MSAEQKARRFERHASQIRVPGVEQFGRYRYATAYEGLRLRTHPGCVEISFLARGYQYYRVRRKMYWLRGGDQFVVFPDEPHDSGGWPEEKGILYWLVIRVGPDEEPILFLDPKRSAALRKALLHLPARHFAADGDAREMMEEILESIERPPRDEYRRIEVGQLILRYLLGMIRAARRNRRRPPSAPIGRCMDYVESHEDELPSVPALARIARLSLPRFQARFREECGVPPREFVLRHKIELAQVQLSEGDLSVTDLAYALGFSSSQYFATVFRRFCGLTPGDFRAKFRKPKAGPRARSNRRV